MSIATNKSAGMSVVSGFSNLSDLMSATEEDDHHHHHHAQGGAGNGGGSGRKAEPRNRGVDRNQSNLSIMSELTDLSANIDNLSLYED